MKNNTKMILLDSRMFVESNLISKICMESVE